MEDVRRRSLARRSSQAGITFNEVSLIIVVIATLVVVAASLVRGRSVGEAGQATLSVGRYLNLNRPADELLRADCTAGRGKDGLLPCVARVKNRATGSQAELRLDCSEDGTGCRASL